MGILNPRRTGASGGWVSSYHTSRHVLLYLVHSLRLPIGLRVITQTKCASREGEKTLQALMQYKIKLNAFKKAKESWEKKSDEKLEKSCIIKDKGSILRKVNTSRHRCSTKRLFHGWKMNLGWHKRMKKKQKHCD